MEVLKHQPNPTLTKVVVEVPAHTHPNKSIENNKDLISPREDETMKDKPFDKVENEVLLHKTDANKINEEKIETKEDNNNLKSASENTTIEMQESGVLQDKEEMASSLTFDFNLETKNHDIKYTPSSSSIPDTCIIDLHQVDNNNRDSNDSPYKHFDTISLSEPSCRVCQCSEEDEKLISPCYCSGSVKWVHESCLVRWMKSAFKDSCELCRKEIEITKRRKPLSKWKLPSQRPTPVLWVLVFVTAIALNLASVVKDASRLCSSTPCLVFYAVGCIGVILGTLFLIYWSKRAKNFIHHWIELNEEWVVVIDHSDRDKSNSTSKKQEKASSNEIV